MKIKYFFFSLYFALSIKMSSKMSQVCWNARALYIGKYLQTLQVRTSNFEL
jgi:hypothetical protein